MNLNVLALVALVPAMTGPAPQSGQTVQIVTRLCSGGALVISVPGSPDRPSPPCHQKGCHAGCNRKRLDPAQ